MTKKLSYFVFLFTVALFGQQAETISTTETTNFVFTPELLAGVTAEANSNFPEHSFQKQLLFNFGWEQDGNPQEWAQRLKGPRTGISLGLADFGNLDSLGVAITAMPFIEFNVFGRKNLKVVVGTGASYFNKKYNAETNPNNQAVTTDLTWSFRLFMHYQVLTTKRLNWRLGGGFFHHSNGHTKLPNQGYNSFLVSLSADIKNPTKKFPSLLPKETFEKSSYYYYSFRSGYGANVLGKPEEFNTKKGIYTLAGTVGKVYNNTFKVGLGFYYRYYQHYYDYIKNNESLVQEGREFDYFTESPWRYATNFGISINGEVLLNHFGIDLQIGINLHKPAYAIDWRINQGWSVVPRVIPEVSNIVLGELDSKYKLKKTISSRLGLNYYLLGTKDAPKNNVFVGFHLNSNLGQADFTELSLGYVHNFGVRQKK